MQVDQEDEEMDYEHEFVEEYVDDISDIEEGIGANRIEMNYSESPPKSASGRGILCTGHGRTASEEDESCQG